MKILESPLFTAVLKHSYMQDQDVYSVIVGVIILSCFMFVCDTRGRMTICSGFKPSDDELQAQRSDELFDRAVLSVLCRTVLVPVTVCFE